MAEGGTAPPPQVFVVDTQASYISTPRDKKSSWARAGQKILFLLLGLLVLGVLVEGYLIYILYQRTASFSHCGSNMPCRNLTHTLGSENQDGRTSSQRQTKESNEIPPHVTKKRPFAHLLGSEHPVGDNNVVLWNSLAQHDSVNIEYNNGRLIIKEEGHYYVYSRVELDVSKDTTPIFHKIMKTSSGYGKEIELLKATSSHCVHKNPANCAAEDIRSSFLAGIFHLQEDDKIFVTLSNVEKLHRSANGNSLGAFMIEP
ncbi:tumor necrosis factor ligand superfamily member 14 isoform X1 [Fundulus heteroclitus]|uniref:tumor necrosis factor ligand superfamily member 14 isoform X1 n=1 Tax=Fundulus heteroclitus TaxID=8078 RepID=UPI00079E4566|nr:tumor necrosis factor ligand superfamily member 14 isoform X1 [Fundulus heteroclitus]XP_035992528.1 tumor necrosis factor ligand superfamily member 14 isoform X1 [Fundulus heteroclitus]XP_035992529.1 tumor necrosis factor ligand superfamily member 14 isoform X1 [Fundulus heteroclitus]